MCEAGGAGSRCPTTCRRHQAVVPLPALPVIPPAASPARPGGPAAGSRVTSVSPAPGTPLLTELHRRGEAQGLFLLAGAQGSGSSWATASGRWGAGGCRLVPEPGGQARLKGLWVPSAPHPEPPAHTPVLPHRCTQPEPCKHHPVTPMSTHPSLQPSTHLSICPSIRPDTPPALSPDTRLSLPPSTSVRPSTSPSAHPSIHYSTPPSQPPLHLPPPFCPPLSYLPALTPPNPQHSPQPPEAFSSADGDNRPPKGTDFGWVGGGRTGAGTVPHAPPCSGSPRLSPRCSSLGPCRAGGPQRAAPGRTNSANRVSPALDPPAPAHLAPGLAGDGEVTSKGTPGDIARLSTAANYLGTPGVG